jgi:hypothetical protein
MGGRWLTGIEWCGSNQGKGGRPCQEEGVGSSRKDEVSRYVTGMTVGRRLHSINRVATSRLLDAVLGRQPVDRLCKRRILGTKVVVFSDAPWAMSQKERGELAVFSVIA